MLSPKVIILLVVVTFIGQISGLYYKLITTYFDILTTKFLGGIFVLTTQEIFFFHKSINTYLLNVLGFPQMEECPFGPCAAPFGPCVADTGNFKKE